MIPNNQTPAQAADQFNQLKRKIMPTSLEQHHARLNKIFETIRESSRITMEITRQLFPPKEDLIAQVKRMSDIEVEGIWRYGSVVGKEISETELISRGKLSPYKFIRFFQKCF